MHRQISAILFLMMLSITPASADSERPALDDVQFTPLSDTVWVHTSYWGDPNFGPFPANGLLVFDGSSSILVDSAWTDEQTGAILDWAEEMGHPVTKAVFTHAHEDKMGGVGAIRDRGIETYALSLTNELAEANGFVPAASDLSLYLNGEPARIGPVAFFYPGGGHSPDNIVAHIEADGVLFGGCLIRPGRARSLGNTEDAVMDHWAAAVELVDAWFPDADIVVPTHGPPGGRELFDLTVDLTRAAVPD